MNSSDNSAGTNSNRATFRDCWLLFGNVNDIGWTHAHNAARKEIHLYLRNKYRSITMGNGEVDLVVDFESIATPDTFFMSEEERHKLIVEEYIREKQCDFIFASSDGILNNRDIEYAKTYPNVSFGRMLVPPQFDNKPPNLVDFWTDWFPSSFVAGAVAASLNNAKNRTSCAGFINAFEKAANAWTHVTGFSMGYQWMNQDPLSKVHVVTMNSYYQPGAEIVAARQLIEQKGCDVIAKHTDPNVSLLSLFLDSFSLLITLCNMGV